LFPFFVGPGWVELVLLTKFVIQLAVAPEGIWLAMQDLRSSLNTIISLGMIE
jgi:hypothetical protein